MVYECQEGKWFAALSDRKTSITCNDVTESWDEAPECDGISSSHTVHIHDLILTITQSDLLSLFGHVHYQAVTQIFMLKCVLFDNLIAYNK